MTTAPNLQWVRATSALPSEPGVTFRVAERLDTGERWIAPLGAPEPWPDDAPLDWLAWNETTT